MLCDYRAGCGEAEASYFAEFDGIRDNDYTEDTGNEFYGWWGRCCQGCLEEIKGLVREHAPSAGLRYVPLDAVNVSAIDGSRWSSNEPDWSKSEQVGNISIFKTDGAVNGDPNSD
jgi:hypothetical protein